MLDISINIYVTLCDLFIKDMSTSLFVKIRWRTSAKYKMHQMNVYLKLYLLNTKVNIYNFISIQLENKCKHQQIISFHYRKLN